MPNNTTQIYEDYLKYTAAWTDLSGQKFLTCLQICVDFFNSRDISSYKYRYYKELQSEVINGAKISLASARKAINQMVKIGFLKPYLGGYREEAVDYLNATTETRRSNVLSKVVYNYSNFQNAMTQSSTGNTNQIKFIIRTLEEVGSLDKKAFVALMTAKIPQYTKGYLNTSDLEALYIAALDDGFIKRKYNQVSHLRNLLGRLNDLCYHKGSIYFKTDADRLFSNEETRKAVRDPYLQRIYKSELEEECRYKYGSERPKCMLEGLDQPVLIASHIKPYKSSEPDEQFDVNNGLLLSKNLDSLFDLGYISFDEAGNILISKELSPEMQKYVSQFSIDNLFINPKRMAYMKYHRKNVFEKRFAHK